MVDIASVEAGVAVAEAIVEAIVKVAPAIEQGVVSAAPYVQAIAGLIRGTNATQDQLDAMLVQLEAASGQFQQPLPTDDGNTAT